jgi:hypothetical protein
MCDPGGTAMNAAGIRFGGRSPQSTTSPSRWAWIAGAALVAVSGQAALAQRQVTAGVPFRGVSDSFFERIGFSANFRAPGFTANLGGFPQAVPQFGGFQPGAGVVGGFAFAGGGGSGRVGFEFSQGSRRSLVSQAGSLTLMDGVPGSLANVTQSPFVISQEPIVPLRPGVPWKQQLGDRIMPYRGTSSASGAAAPPPAADGAGRPATAGDAIAQQAAASGERPIHSLAEIRRQRQAADEAKNEQALAHFQRGQQAERDGKPGVARIHYQIALRQASGDLRRQVQERIAALEP